MGVECEKCGCDEWGNYHDGYFCPACKLNKLESENEKLRAALDEEMRKHTETKKQLEVHKKMYYAAMNDKEPGE